MKKKMTSDFYKMRVRKIHCSSKRSFVIFEFSKLPAFALALLLVFAVFAIPVSANVDYNFEEASEYNYSNNYLYGHCDTPDFSVANTYTEEELNGGLYSPQGATTLPASYDLRDLGLVTSVKNQDPYATCWAFSAINSIESNTIKKGYETLSTADFSELQLAYFMYNRNNVTTGTPLPELSGLNGDDIKIVSDDNYLNIGGFSKDAALHLATGIGVVRESDVPYEWANPKLSLSCEYAVGKNVYVVSNALFASPVMKDDVKTLLTEYGCGVVSYNSNDYYYNTSVYKGKSSSCYYQNVNSSVDHTVSIAGWDDNYPKENFKIKPQNNGAWLIKNSWGDDDNDNGYFWLSYEDISLSDVVFYEVRKADSFDNIYQYDGSLGNRYLYWDNSESGYIETPKAINRFTAKGNEVITDVSFVTYNRDVSYKIEILKNGDEVVLTQSGTVEQCGYHTVTLLQPVSVEKGEKFSAAVTFSAKAGTVTMDKDVGLAFPMDMNYYYEDSLRFISTSLPEQGYFVYDNGYVEDVHNKHNANLRIKVFTTNMPKISAATLSLSSDIAVRFYVNDSSLAGYHNSYMTAAFNDTEYTLQPTADPQNPRRMFTFRNISPAEMNETICVKLYATKDGEASPVFCDELDYSIKDYCVNQMNKAGVKNDLTTLCADLLNYGSASQLYCGETDMSNLANSTLSDEQKDWASLNTTPDIRNDKSISETGNDSVGVWRAASLNLYSDISLFFKFTTSENPENLTAIVTYGKDGENKAEINKFIDSTYGAGLPCKYIDFDKLNALELNYPITVVLKNKDGATSKTLTYSVDAYAFSKTGSGKKPDNLTDLVDSMMKYIRSVDNLFNEDDD